jgi:hypothetical protein
MKHEELTTIYLDPSKTQQERVVGSIEAFQHYMNNYTYNTCCSGNGAVFTDDVLYMLGVALNPESNRFHNGFAKFKKELVKHIQRETTLSFKGEKELELLTEKCTEILSGELSIKRIGMIASKLYDGGVRIMESNEDA